MASLTQRVPTLWIEHIPVAMCRRSKSAEKMSVLSNLTTLTIDIQKALQTWTDFQHQLVITAPTIVEVCVQKRPTIRLHSPPQ